MIKEIEDAIYDKLVGDATVLGYVSTRVYLHMAPPGVALPYIVFIPNAGGDMNITPRQSADVNYAVKAVSDSVLEARNIADAIRGALHNEDLTMANSWTAYACQHQTVIHYVEQVERKQFFHAGGVYRIRAHYII